MIAKTKAGIGDLHFIMSNVNALVDMLLPPNEFGETKMTPEILDQITAIQDAVCDSLELPRMPTIPPDHAQ
jgi:hypothetical protein